MGKKSSKGLAKAPLSKALSVNKVRADNKKPVVIEPDFWQKKSTQIAGAITIGLLFAVGMLLAISARYSFVEVYLAGNKLEQETNVAKLTEQMNNQVKGYKFQVAQKNKIVKYAVDDAGLSIDVTSSINTALEKQKPRNLVRRLFFWQTYNLPLNVVAEQKKLEKFIDTRMTKVISPAKNATVKVVSGKAKIVKEKPGKSYGLNDPQASLLAHVSNLEQNPLILEKISSSPSITSKQAEVAKLSVDAYLKKKVIFSIEGTTIEATPEDIGAWIEINPVKKTKTIDVSINSGKILDYINTVASPYVSPPKNAITLPGSSRVLIAGQNGVDVVNKESVAKEIAEKMLSSDSITRTLPVQYQTYKTISATPHDKWVAVDLSSKVMYVYEKTKLVRTILISGGAPETPTVEGTFQIGTKISSQTMTGPNADGSQFNQPNVPYVNYFYADFAIHGVYWRPDSYLGNINASHGCVGLSVSNAAWFYNWAPVGTTVITFS